MINSSPSPRLSNLALLAAWEEGRLRTAVGRSLTMLQYAFPGADAGSFLSWSVGRRDAALLDVHQATFGSAIEGVTASPCCGEELDLTFSVADIRETCGDADGEFELVVGEADGEYSLVFRLPTCSDLLAAAQYEHDEAAIDALVERCVIASRYAGTAVPAASLPAGVRERLGAAMAERDPQADVRLDLTCPSCRHGWQVWFDIGDFLWARMTERARQLIGDVHVLALTYKWTEREILALSDTRRQMYLDLVL